MGNLRHEWVEELSKSVRLALPPIAGCIVGSSLGIPPKAYDFNRRQYDADIILDRVLYQIPGEQKVLTVLDVDLYTSSQNLNFIFGQAQLRGRVALVSTCRLNQKFYKILEDKTLLFNRLVKEAVHELGHTFGLVHCPNPGCVMSFSNSVADVDRKGPSLCKSCHEKIQATPTI
jgi:archaemetzincin